MKNRIKLLGIIVLTAIMGFSMIACDMGGSKGSGKIRNIDIIGAKALMIAPASSVSRSARASDGNVFVKQIDDGSWVQVKISDEDGNGINNLPMYIYDVAEDWMVIGFFTNEYFDKGHTWKNMVYNDFHVNMIPDSEYSFYLVRKTNGDAYDITSIGGYPPHDRVFSDKNGNIYYIVTGEISSFGSSRIVKVTPGSTQATAEWLTSDVIEVDFFANDNDGNILYSGSSGYRLRTANGTVLAIDSQGVPYSIFSPDDGNIYDNIPVDTDDTGSAILHKVEVTGNTIDDITITPVEFDIVNAPDLQSTGYFIVNGNSFCFYSTDRTLVFYLSMIFSFPKNGSPKCVYLTEAFISMGSNEIALGSKNLFICRGNRILIIDPDTGSVTTLVPSNTYDYIYRFAVSSNDIITINALTFDGKKILANIYPDGSTVILSESFSEEETLILAKVQ